jgi:hypothetical protein
MIKYGQSRPEVVPVGLLAWLFAKTGGRQASRSKRARPSKPAQAQGAGKAPGPSGSGVYSVERSVTTLVRSGLKRRKTTSTTKEWRHGNCQVRHKSKAAATRCRNP